MAVFVLVCPVFAEINIKDVPKDHWAASAVYDLINLGVTKGFPDGTYRGDKYINRYEIAIFLSKLAKALGGDNIQSDLKQVKEQIVEMQKGPKDDFKISGGLTSRWILANPLSAQSVERSALSDYRLILTASREISETANIKINLDTMDYGFFSDGSTSPSLAANLLDIESNLIIATNNNPIYLQLTYGPGPKRHAADPTGAVPSEIDVTYQRPNTGVFASTDISGFELGGGYFSSPASSDATGKISTSLIKGAVSYTFKRFFVLSNLKVDLLGDYMSDGVFSTTNRSVRAKLSFAAALGEKTAATAAVGMSNSTQKMMVEGSLSLNDPWDTGTVFSLHAAKVGSEYINPSFSSQQFDSAGYDTFSRPLENGVVNVDSEFIQSVSDQTRLVGKGAVRLSSDYKYSGNKARLTAQGGISHTLAPNVNFDASYRYYQDKSTGDTSDLASVGLVYKF